MKKPIIIFGTGRSGTTILMDALFRHKDVAYFPNYLNYKPQWLWLNYLRNLHDNQNYRVLKKRNKSFAHQIINPLISKPVEGYSIWKYILPNHINFSRNYLSDFDISEIEKAKVNTYFESLVCLQNRSRLALKITGPGRLKFLSELLPEAKFIWLKRDFIPTLSSFLKVGFFENRKINELWWKSKEVERKLNKFPEIKEDPILFTAFQLHEIIKDIEFTIQHLNLNVFTVNYEDFTKNPNKSMQDVLSFCELDRDQDCISFLDKTIIEDRNKAHTSYFDDKTLQNINNLRIKLNQLEE
jgi:hypothetical protein